MAPHLCHAAKIKKYIKALECKTLYAELAMQTYSIIGALTSDNHYLYPNTHRYRSSYELVEYLNFNELQLADLAMRKRKTSYNYIT